eukprot:COSAG01_NODE_10267_length_2205_cov_4.059354_4_plen_89_part_00
MDSPRPPASIQHFYFRFWEIPISVGFRVGGLPGIIFIFVSAHFLTEKLGQLGSHEQIKLSKRRTLVVEDMILTGANHLTQFTTDPHRG